MGTDRENFDGIGNYSEYQKKWKKEREEYINKLSSEVSGELLVKTWTDGKGVKYGKSDCGDCYLLKAPKNIEGEYTADPSTMMICDFAFEKCRIERINILGEKITENINSPRVEIIGANAFCDCENLKEIVIPSSVVRIGESAFADCESLKEVDIPDSVTSIGDDAFANCINLEKVSIGKSVKKIGSSAFYNCRSLTKFEVSFYNEQYCSLDGMLYSNGTTERTRTPFDFPEYYYKSMTELIKFPSGSSIELFVIPNSVINIGEEAFGDCGRLREVVIPTSVTNIGDGAFEYCSDLEKVSISDSVTSIGEGAFYGCENLKEVVIPDSVKSIDDDTFDDCPNLEKVTIGVESIKEGMFRDLTNLKEVIILDSVKNIGDSAFEGCSNLEKISIGNAVTSIEASAFSSCRSLAYIDVSMGNEHYCSKRGVLYSKKMTELIRFHQASPIVSYEIPNSVKRIGKGAFCGCSDLEEIVIPNSVRSIGENAFHNCLSLKEIIIPDSVKSIGESAFSNCKKNYDGIAMQRYIYRV